MAITDSALSINPRKAIRTLIFGSCVSRDLFSFPGAESIELVDFYSRSSFASLASAPAAVGVNFNNLTSAFQRRMVARDINKDFLSYISKANFDVLLIDLIDERYNVYQYIDQSVCTISKEFKETKYKFAPGSGRNIYTGSPQHLRLWQIGWMKFMKAIHAIDAAHRIRISKVYWANETDTGTAVTAFSKDVIDSNNAYLQILYENIEQDLGKEAFFEFDPELLKAASKHKWGPAPFHYSDEFYLDLIQKVKSPSEDNITAMDFISKKPAGDGTGGLPA
ncbi:DUF6270 domain-containing protein [Advenella incenata]